MEFQEPLLFLERQSHQRLVKLLLGQTIGLSSFVIPRLVLGCVPVGSVNSFDIHEAWADEEILAEEHEGFLVNVLIAEAELLHAVVVLLFVELVKTIQLDLVLLIQLMCCLALANGSDLLIVLLAVLGDLRHILNNLFMPVLIELQCLPVLQGLHLLFLLAVALGDLPGVLSVFDVFLLLLSNEWELVLCLLPFC